MGDVMLVIYPVGYGFGNGYGYGYGYGYGDGYATINLNRRIRTNGDIVVTVPWQEQ